MDYNSMDEGRDIPPDEEIPNYWQRTRLPVGQQVSDSQTYNGYTEDGAMVYNTHGVFAPRQPQRHNGTTYYNSEENRLTTFSDWRYQHVVRKKDLARNGFVYTGTSDKVRCVFCNSILRQWEAGDIVEQEHRRLNPRCPFNNGEEVGNIPFNPLAYSHHNGCSATSPVSPTQSRNYAQDSEERGHDIHPIEDRYGSHAAYQNQMQNGGDRHRHDSASASSNYFGREYSTRPQVQAMAIEPARLETFKDWPPQMKQKPEQLAQAGLYYTGDGDRTKCFHCAGLLYNWDPEDDPFVEHARWFPACQYMKFIKGEEFIKNAKSGKATNDAVMPTPAVSAVLADGFTVEQISKALEAMKKKEGSAMVISARGILETIYALEDASRQPTVEGSLPYGYVRKRKEENESLKDKELCKISMATNMRSLEEEKRQNLSHVVALFNHRSPASPSQWADNSVRFTGYSVGDDVIEDGFTGSRLCFHCQRVVSDLVEWRPCCHAEMCVNCYFCSQRMYVCPHRCMQCHRVVEGVCHPYITSMAQDGREAPTTKFCPCEDMNVSSS